jgi:predicted CXXCH cytochrome family protein
VKYSIIFLIGFIVLMAPLKIYSADSCLDCHSDLMDKKFKHPAAEMDCGSCHAPHGESTGKPHRLYDVPNSLCLGCHEDKDKGHVVRGHPIEKAKDPIYPDRKFTCISCHNPHSSNQPHMFRYNTKIPVYESVNYSICAVCHWDKYTGANSPKPPRPPWND